MAVQRDKRSNRIVLVTMCAGVVIALASSWFVRSFAMTAEPAVVLNGKAASDEMSYVALPSFVAARAETGVAIHDIADTRLLDAVKDVGFSFVRTDLFWEAVQAPDGWHFGSFDKLVSNLAQRQLGALFILGYKHYQFSPDQPPTTPAQLNAFYTYVQQSVNRYRGANVRFEVWNEEDDKVYWLADPSPTNYRNLLKTAVKAARAANPTVTIASGGVQQIDLDFIRSVGDISSATLTGPDAISVHPYRQEYPETVFADYRKLREQLSTYKNSPAVWSTEWSYPSFGYKYVAAIGNGHAPHALALQANYAVRRFLVDWISGVGLTAYYDMRDDGTNPTDREHNFGLLDASNNRLPAYDASKHLFAFTADTKSAKYFIDEDHHYIVLKLATRTGATKYVIWSYGDGSAVKLDISHLPGRAAITDMYGKPIGTTGTLTVPETSGPVFISMTSW
ncbi:cellulase family glycosylhydrolase [Paraburkholderia sp. PREW-6R]|uniref:cellulase family glycosylhydrolase n=1 Tax=Paraburkholderia sp. PREW-6R TaxID=3141544 RepID=UPI0031F54987